MDLIHADHNFSFSGYLDQTNTAEMGEILGSSMMLVVRVTRCATDWQQKSISAPVDDGFIQWEIYGDFEAHYSCAVEVENESNDGTLTWSVNP